MSKVWKLPVIIPEGVKCEYKDNVLKATGPKGTLILDVHPNVTVDIEDNQINVSIKNTEEDWNLRWLFRVLIKNTIEGVINWYEKKLHVLGVWFEAKIEWSNLVMKLWYSHLVKYKIPNGINWAVEKDPKWNSIITISWIDKQLVGQISARIREIKKPEPYKWKWIRYYWEAIKMKAWKTAKK